MNTLGKITGLTGVQKKEGAVSRFTGGLFLKITGLTGVQKKDLGEPGTGSTSDKEFDR